ncbi:MAG TPA: translation initiation factor [Luteibaculaceae bacterium]|nr:translation initiation factor [Luteibaculaceae bacterium]
MSKSKKRIDIVYSTNPNFSYQEEEEQEVKTLDPAQQILHVMIDKKSRAGKEVTLIANFVGTDGDLQELGKKIKTKCGVGGTVKDGTILIQGNFRDKIMLWLQDWGYKTKRIGG